MSILSYQSEKIVLSVIGIGVLFVAYSLYRSREAIEELITEDFNPAHNENLVNQGVSKFVNFATDGERKDSGDFLFCLFNPSAITCNPELAEIANKYGLSYYDYNENNEPIRINPQVTMLHAQEVGL